MGLASNVVAFPISAVVSFDDAWESRRGQMRTRGDGKEKTRKLWNKHAKLVGQDRLLAALRRYLKEEKEPTCGYPGLSVWLNGERYDHWMPEDSKGVGLTDTLSLRFPEPYRSALVASCGEAWCKSYIDRAKLDGTVLVVSGGMAASRIRERAQEMKESGLTALRLEPIKVI